MNKAEHIALAAALLLSSPAASSQSASAGPAPRPRVVHVFLALADNKNQGIVPVPARLGNGRDPANNLYWGAAFGIRTFFRKSSEWRAWWCGGGPNAAILERCVFRHSDPDGYLIADAYDGAQIRQAFQGYMKQAGSEPLLWTTGLMAPEAYALEAALTGRFAGESATSIRLRAAAAYSHYQKCGFEQARRLFASTW